MKRGLAVAFPGTGYTCAEPLFAACIDLCRARGYDCLALDYSSVPFRQIETVEEALDRAQALAEAQLGAVRFEEYRDVVFLSKSLGTALAGRLAAQRGISPRQFYLTPIAQALPYVQVPRRVIGMVIGSADRILDYRTVQAFCAERGIPCLIAEGVGHNLKHEDGAATEALNRRITAMCADGL